MSLNPEAYSIGRQRDVSAVVGTNYRNYLTTLESWIFWVYAAVNSGNLVPGWGGAPLIGPISPGPVLFQYGKTF